MDKQNKTTTLDLKEGISVILPTYKGERWIVKCLNSLADQTLEKKLFEVIVIVNGEKDKTEKLVDEFQKKHADLNIVKIVIDKPGVSNARNKGIKKASRKYTTFIDDDDWVSENYLASLYENIDLNTVTISQAIDVDETGNQDTENNINIQVHQTSLK